MLLQEVRWLYAMYGERLADTSELEHIIQRLEKVVVKNEALEAENTDSLQDISWDGLLEALELTGNAKNKSKNVNVTKYLEMDSFKTYFKMKKLLNTNDGQLLLTISKKKV